MVYLKYLDGNLETSDFLVYYFNSEGLDDYSCACVIALVYQPVSV